jgi:predicted nuclease of restriction endonuclease-like RecB superfamily
MLTPELVRARKRNGELVLLALGGKQRERALELARGLLALTEEAVGSTREELRESWRELTASARERRLAEGLCKLIEDACDFAAESSVDASTLRQRVFTRAALERSRARESGAFDRDAIVREVCSELALSSGDFERALYSDLRGAHVLLGFQRQSADHLVSSYDEAQRQAVLLRAVRVTARVWCRSPLAYRALFNKLKFRRLLYRMKRIDGGAYELEIDGPFSLFEAVTKYGLNLALSLAALEACDSLDLTATVQWGRSRQRLLFRHTHRAPADGERGAELELPTEVHELMTSFAEIKSSWSVEQSQEIFELPGVGVCVPDLVFVHRDSNVRVHLEVMGYWSRDAVWRRVELVQAGIAARFLFAVSTRLRVSEDVLPPTEASALYVYKGSMSARAIARKLDALVARKPRSRDGRQGAPT